MSLREIAAADFRKNLQRDNDDVKFTFADTSEITVKGKVNRVDMSLDPAGVPFWNPHTVVTVSRTYEDEAGDVQTLPALVDSTILESTGVSGDAIKSYCVERHYDDVLGFVSIECQQIEIIEEG